MYGDYRGQLETWIRKTGKSQKELAAFSASFFSLEKPLAEAQVTNAKKVPPTREEGRRNLYILMGLLHAFDVIDEAECRAFLEAHDVAYEEDGPWEETWRSISAGAEKTRSLLGQFKTTDRRDKEKPSSNGRDNVARSHVWPKRAVMIVGLSLCVLAAFVLMKRFSQAQVNWCVTSPTEVRRIGAISRFYVPVDVRLNNFDIFPFYIYFNGEYVTSEDLDLEGLEQPDNRWAVTIRPAWIKTHPDWSQRDLWRVNYVC